MVLSRIKNTQAKSVMKACRRKRRKHAEGGKLGE